MGKVGQGDTAAGKPVADGGSSEQHGEGLDECGGALEHCGTVTRQDREAFTVGNELLAGRPVWFGWVGFSRERLQLLGQAVSQGLGTLKGGDSERNVGWMDLVE